MKRLKSIIRNLISRVARPEIDRMTSAIIQAQEKSSQNLINSIENNLNQNLHNLLSPMIANQITNEFVNLNYQIESLKKLIIPIYLGSKEFADSSLQDILRGILKKMNPYDLEWAEKCIVRHSEQNYVYVDPSTAHKIYAVFDKSFKIISDQVCINEYRFSNFHALCNALLRDLSNLPQDLKLVLILDDEVLDFLYTANWDFKRADQLVLRICEFERFSAPLLAFKLDNLLNKTNEEFKVINFSTGNEAGLVNISNIPFPRTIKLTFANESNYKVGIRNQNYDSCLDPADNPKIPKILMGLPWGVK